MLQLKFKYYLVTVLLSIGFVCPLTVMAGFLEMPDVSDVPDIERRTMLRDMDVPGVRDRNPDPEAGPRLAVSAFRLQGMVEFPELGITKAELDKLIEAIRSEMMAEGMLLDSGFTLEELGEVSDLLVKIEEETTDRHVSTLETQQLVWLVRDQRSKRGITLGQIENIADKITAFYRERGFILAKAYIPKQEVRDGVVNLTMHLGLLGNVVIIENKLYKDTALKEVFDDVLTMPVTNTQIEERLYLINKFPGLNVSGFFEPGDQIGDTRLTVKVNSEKLYTGNVRLDNHGLKGTGKNRLYADVSLNNPLGLSDFVQVGALSTSSPSNTTYYLLRYNTNLFSPRFNVDLAASTSQFVLDKSGSAVLGGLELSGVTTQESLTALYKLTSSRVANREIGIKHEAIESDLNLGISSVDFLDDKISNNSLFYNYDVLDEENKVLHQGNVYITRGKFVYGEDLGQSPDYFLLTSDYTNLSFFKIPYFESNTRVIFRASVLISDETLSSLNQFSLAGPTRARAFEPNLFSADIGAYAGSEWIFNSPDLFDFEVFGRTRLKELVQPFLFADVAYGVKRSLLVEKDEKATIADAGIGLRFSYINKVRGNLQFAFPVQSSFTNSDISKVEDKLRIVFDIQYSF